MALFSFQWNFMEAVMNRIKRACSGWSGVVVARSHSPHPAFAALRTFEKFLGLQRTQCKSHWSAKSPPLFVAAAYLSVNETCELAEMEMGKKWTEALGRGENMHGRCPVTCEHSETCKASSKQPPNSPSSTPTSSEVFLHVFRCFLCALFSQLSNGINYSLLSSPLQFLQCLSTQPSSDEHFCFRGQTPPQWNHPFPWAL